MDTRNSFEKYDLEYLIRSWLYDGRRALELENHKLFPFLTSANDFDIVFSRNLSFKDRKNISIQAKKLGLFDKIIGHGKTRHIIVTKYLWMWRNFPQEDNCCCEKALQMLKDVKTKYSDNGYFFVEDQQKLDYVIDFIEEESMCTSGQHMRPRGRYD